jgi:hypothetical protein
MQVCAPQQAVQQRADMMMSGAHIACILPVIGESNSGCLANAGESNVTTASDILSSHPSQSNPSFEDTVTVAAARNVYTSSSLLRAIALLTQCGLAAGSTAR